MTLNDIKTAMCGEDYCFYIAKGSKIIFDGERSLDWITLNWDTVAEYLNDPVVRMDMNVGHEDSEWTFPVLNIYLAERG